MNCLPVSLAFTFPRWLRSALLGAGWGGLVASFSLYLSWDQFGYLDPGLTRFVLLITILSGAVLGVLYYGIRRLSLGGATAPADENLTCQRCGRQVLHAQLLLPQKPNSSEGNRRYCRRCWFRRSRRGEWGLLIGLSLFGSCLLGMIWYHPEWEHLGGLANLQLGLVASVLMVPLHELGHALAAWIVRARLFKIYLGLGLTCYQDRQWGLWWEKQPLSLDSGYTQVGYRETSWLRLRHFLLILGGPLANALVLAAAWFWLVPEDARFSDFFMTSSLGATLVLGNLILLAGSLWPRSMTCSYQGMSNETLSSDGLQLLAIPRMTQAQVHELYANRFLLELQEADRLGERSVALAWCQQLQEAFPDAPLPQYLHAALRLHVGETEQARDLCRQLLGKENLENVMRCITLDAVATADLVLLLRGIRSLPDGDADAPAVDLLDEANQCVAEAEQLGQEHPTMLASILGTRGSLLIEQGQLDEGVRLLEQVLEENEERQIQCICVAYLAYVSALRGDHVRADEQWQQAAALHPHSAFLAPMRDRLQQITSQPRADVAPQVSI